MSEADIVEVLRHAADGRRFIVRATGVVTIKRHLQPYVEVRSTGTVRPSVTAESIIYATDQEGPKIDVTILVPGGTTVDVEQSAGVVNQAGRSVVVDTPQ